MNALILGYGSIGKRHARVLSDIGCRVGVLSRRQVDFVPAFSDLREALATIRPEYVVIADSTERHHETLAALAGHGYGGILLVEKPLFDRPMAPPANQFKHVYVGYNLRFHLVIAQLRTLLDGQKMLSAQAYVGQYLPDWRPGSDYRESYSASAAQGGGVLRDLSHEIDYLMWLTGQWRRVSALGGHLSSLEIDSDDVFALALESARCPVVTLQMNYLDRRTRRFVIINTSEHTIEADLVAGSITLDRESRSFAVEPDQSYRAMHAAILSGNASVACTLSEALEVVRLIDAAEQSAHSGAWIYREE